MKEESRIVEETRQKIATGELTYDQMKEKLIAAINKEYEKEGEPDVNLINACEELLAELATDGQPLPETHQEKYGEVIRQNIQVSHQVRNRGGFVKRLAVSLVVLVLLLGVGQMFLHREWFEHGTTDDEQQHTIQGFVADPNLIAKCIAEEGNSSAMFYSDDYEEARKYLGFDLPTVIFLKDWNPIHFFIGFQSSYVKCDVQYINPKTNDRVTVQIGMFTDVKNAYTTFEQNREGTEEKIDKTVVYYAENDEKYTITWLEENCIWRCYGSVDNKQLTTVVEKILGGSR